MTLCVIIKERQSFGFREEVIMAERYEKITEIHAHDEMSNLRIIDCNIRVEDLINRAFDIGLNGIAVTNHDALGSHLRAIRAYNKIKEDNPNTDFKVLLGNEIYLNESLEPSRRYNHFILIAKDEIGYRQLKELSSFAWKNSFFDRGLERPTTTYDKLKEVVGKDKGHLIGSTACLGSFLGSKILELLYMENPNEEQIRDDVDGFLNYMTSVLGEDFYIEMQAGKSEEQKEYNKVLLKIANAYGIKYVIANDVHYLNEEEKELHSAFLRSRDGDRETEEFYNSTFLKTASEIYDWMPYLSQEEVEVGLRATMEIHDKCSDINLFQPTAIPNVPLPSNIKLDHIFKDYYSSHKNIDYFSKSESGSDVFLLWNIEQGFSEKKQEFNKENIDRIDIELEQIKLISQELGQSLSSYYNLVDIIVDIMWDDSKGNSLVGVARGSVTGFYLCYLTDISQLNPIEHNLPWWRHIHHTKIELADIDLDTEASKREQIFQAVAKEFGSDEYGYDKTINICTFKKEGSRSALLTACRGLGINNDIAQELADYIKSERGQQWSLDECLYGDEAKERKKVDGFKEKIDAYEHVEETARKIEGLIVGRSTHASGVIIYPTTILDYNSIMTSPNGKLVTAFDMNDSEDMGGLKVDFLTIEGLDKIRTELDLLILDKVVEHSGNIRDTYNKILHPDVLEYDDEKMWEYLDNSEIISLFQFDTDVGNQAQKKIKPRSLKELALANSVMRLMSSDGETPMDKFARYKNDIKEAYKDMAKYGLNAKEIAVVERHLLDKNMMAIEQEDVMELTMDKDIVGFDMVGANKLRKIIAKKKTKDIEEMTVLFFEVGKKLGTRPNFLNYIWKECIGIQLG